MKTSLLQMFGSEELRDKKGTWREMRTQRGTEWRKANRWSETDVMTQDGEGTTKGAKSLVVTRR